MSWSGDSLSADTISPGGFCLVGYGNPFRRDDGLGPYVVAGLAKLLAGQPDGRFIIRHQLEPELVDEMSEADLVVLIDATVENLPEGWKTETVMPRRDETSVMTHEVLPGFLMALLETIHNRRPTTWLVSIQGDDFDYGETLTAAATARADQVIAALAEMIPRRTLT